MLKGIFLYLKENKLKIDTEFDLMDTVYIATWTGEETKYMPMRCRITRIFFDAHDKAVVELKYFVNGDEATGYIENQLFSKREDCLELCNKTNLSLYGVI